MKALQGLLLALLPISACLPKHTTSGAEAWACSGDNCDEADLHKIEDRMIAIWNSGSLFDNSKAIYASNDSLTRAPNNIYCEFHQQNGRTWRWVQDPYTFHLHTGEIYDLLLTHVAIGVNTMDVTLVGNIGYFDDGPGQQYDMRPNQGYSATFGKGQPDPDMPGYESLGDLISQSFSPAENNFWGPTVYYPYASRYPHSDAGYFVPSAERRCRDANSGDLGGIHLNKAFDPLPIIHSRLAAVFKQAVREINAGQ